MMRIETRDRLFTVWHTIVSGWYL